MNSQALFSVAAAFVLFATASTDTMPVSQTAQAELAQHLLAVDPGERSQALTAVRSMEIHTIGPELRKALLALLDRETKAINEATMGGVPIEQVLDPEFHARVCQTVAELGDPLAIPALARALGSCGWVIHRHLAAFGDQAAPDVLAVVTSSRSSSYAVTEGLTALRFMLEQRPQHPLSPAVLERIRAVAQQRLTGRQYFTVLWAAIDLAIVSDDPSLRGIVTALAADRAEVLSRGIEKPDIVDKTRQLAADRLAGIPPLPRN